MNKLLFPFFQFNLSRHYEGEKTLDLIIMNLLMQFVEVTIKNRNIMTVRNSSTVNTYYPYKTSIQ